MAKTQSPLNGYFVDCRVVFLITEDFKVGEPDKNGIIGANVKDIQVPEYVGYGGVWVDELWNCFTWRLENLKRDHRGLKIPDDFNYELKAKDENANGGFYTYNPSSDSHNKERVVDIEQMRDKGFKLFKLRDDELNIEPENVTTEEIKKVLDDRLGGFNIS